MMAAGIVMAVAAVASAAASYASAQQQKQAAKAQARSAEESAQFAATQAAREHAQIMGRQRAIAAASGVEPGSGSPLMIELDNARQAKLDELNIIRTGNVQASALNWEAKAQDYKMASSIFQGLAGAGSAGLQAYRTSL